MKSTEKRPEVLLFFDGTQTATEAFVKLILRNTPTDRKETIEKGSDFDYNEAVVHPRETAGLVS